MKVRSLLLHVASSFFLVSVATSGLAQGGPSGGGAGSSLQTQVIALQQQVTALQTALDNEIAARIAGDQAPTGQSASTAGWQGGNVVLPSFGSVDLPLIIPVTIGSAGAVVVASYNVFGWSQSTTATCTYYTRPTVDGVEAGTTAAIAHLRVNAFEGLSHTVALPNLAVGPHQLGVRVYSNCIDDIYFSPWGGPAGVAAHGHALTAVVIKL